MKLLMPILLAFFAIFNGISAMDEGGIVAYSDFADMEVYAFSTPKSSEGEWSLTACSHNKKTKKFAGTTHRYVRAPGQEYNSSSSERLSSKGARSMFNTLEKAYLERAGRNIKASKLHGGSYLKAKGKGMLLP